MGVPKFFRWLSERYPCLSEELKEYQIPEFDNLYLDMNGIIHVCSHPNDFDPHFRISEEQIFTDIFHYIEVLFRLIRPKKLFFMAVDGVAPRAKMNQQRGRRFCSAKEAENLEKKALEKGESLPSQKRFDSNCITPGTSFMAKLQEQLKYFVANKISNDKLWQAPTVILSGHSVPGEGEHKIMDYIRYMRSRPDWDPYTRHCLYGLDADLIILGLCTHEPNFSLLREEVKFVKSKKSSKTATPETTNYNLLHLSLLRGYLDLEFQSLKKKLPFHYDIECIIDDWVLMGFLVGNDFIPHLPNLHIHCNALNILYDTYRAVLPELDGYINENGQLNMARFEKFLVRLSQFDTDHFNETYADMKYFESKTGRKLFPEIDVQTEDGGKRMKIDEDALKALIESSRLEICELDDADDFLEESLEPAGLETLTIEEESDRLFAKEFSSHKKDYYLNKMAYEDVSPEVLRREAEGYVTALQWILFYYYRGCPSWSWYYPHHYSPYISDLHSFSSLQVKFDCGRPFLPFQQLLAVLPAASKELLPEVYQTLMVSQESPIIDYYPSEFKFDLNGKKQEWEAVVLIPFIEEKRLLEAMEPQNEFLTEEERLRNSHGPMHVYNYSTKGLGKFAAPDYFPEIGSNHAKCTELFPSQLAVPLKDLVVGRHPSLADKETLYMPRFPVFSTLEITGTLEKRAVTLFEHPSRNENMIIRIKERREMKLPLEKIADDMFDKDYIYVSYPHLVPAKVKMLQSQHLTVTRPADNGLKFPPEKNHSGAMGILNRKIDSLKELHIKRYGIDLEKCNAVVYACPLEGTKFSFSGDSGQGYTEMIWSSEVVAYPLDTCIVHVNQREEERQRYSKVIPLAEVFPPGSSAFILGPIDYGNQCLVKEVEGAYLRIELVKTSTLDLTPVRNAISNSITQYYSGYQCAQRLGISSHLFSRITSGIIVQSPHTDSDKTNIGLALKLVRSNLQMVGFTRKEENTWLYSDASIEMVRQYMDKFPDLFEYLAKNTSDDIFFKDKMFPDQDCANRLSEIRNWLKTLEKGELRSLGSELLEPNIMKVLEQAINNYSEVNNQLKIVRLKPHYLYMPKPELMVAAPDPDAEHRILDRIVYVRECHSIPLGAKGTIIGIEKKSTKSIVSQNTGWEEAATLYDIVFDKEVIGGQALYGIKNKLVYRLSRQVFINLSYGERKYGSYGQSNPVVENWRTNAKSSSRKQQGKPADQANSAGKTMLTPKPSTVSALPNPANSTQASVDSSIPSQQPSPNSVNDFFKAYRDCVIQTVEWKKQHGTPEAVPTPAPVPPAMTDKASLTDMWNMFKNLKVKNAESGDKDAGGSSNVILSQTFTRSSTCPVQQPASTPDDQFAAHSNSSGNTKTANQFVEQTAALKKILCIRPSADTPISVNNNSETVMLASRGSCERQSGVTDKYDNWRSKGRACGHLPSCSTYFKKLLIYYHNMFDVKISYEMEDQYYIFSCYLSDGYYVAGTPSKDIAEAEELMACKCISVLINRYGEPEEKNRRDFFNIRDFVPPYQNFSCDDAVNLPDRASAGNVATGCVNWNDSNYQQCGHLPSCLIYFGKLIEFYADMEDPQMWYMLLEDGKFVCYCRFMDGLEFCGAACRTKQEARDSVACKGVNIVLNRYGLPQKKNRRRSNASNAPKWSKPLYQENWRVRSMATTHAAGAENTGASSNQGNYTQILRQPPTFAQHAHESKNAASPSKHGKSPSKGQNVIPMNQEPREAKAKKRNRPKVKIAARFHHPITPN